MAGKLPQPQNKSSQTVQEFVVDPFTTAKVTFFVLVAKQILPFLATDLCNMFGELMRSFIKTTVTSEVKTPLKLAKLDPAHSSIHASHSKIDLGFTADRKIKGFWRKECFSFRWNARSSF